MGAGASMAGVEPPFLLKPIMAPPFEFRLDALEITEWTPLTALDEEKQALFDGAGGEEFDMLSWNYNIWNLNKDDLYTLGSLVLQKQGLIDKFKLDPVIYGNFLRAVDTIMDRNANPYHCFFHIMDVMHSTFVILHTGKGGEYLSELDRLAVTIGAICHDMDHPGTNNVYHVNKVTPLALLYNDASILENYHCARTFELFSHAQFDVLGVLDAAQRKEVRKIIIMVVMGTDMTFHFAMKAEFDKMAPRLREKAPAVADQKDRDLMLKTFLHAADVSNPAKRWDVCKRWSDMVCEEFFAQGDLEKAERLPVSMNCDRDTTFQDELSMNFSDFIVGPFYMSIANLLPHTVDIVRNLKTNRAAWFDMYKERVDSDNANEALAAKMVGWNTRAANTTAAFDLLIKECDEFLVQ